MMKRWTPTRIPSERLSTAVSFLNPRFSRINVHENRRCWFILYILYLQSQ